METDLGKWIINQEIDKEKALLCLKWMLVRHIDGYWGAGDKHLFTLKLLMALDPKDKVLKKLYNRIIKDIEMIEKNTPNLVKDEIYAEDVYRDKGHDEAKYYEKQIKKKYGEMFFEKLEDIYWGFF
jgi:hypothetical protein